MTVHSRYTIIYYRRSILNIFSLFTIYGGHKMHTIAFTVKETQYDIKLDDFFYYEGLICSSLNFGEFLIMFCDINLNDLANKINYPIKDFFINREESIKSYIENCQVILSQNYNPIIVSFFLNEIEDLLLNVDIQEVNVKMNEIFQAYAIGLNSMILYVCNKYQQNLY